MRTVRDESGHRYLLLKQSGESSLVRDPQTGDESYLENDRLTPVEGESSLETAAKRVPSPARRILTAVHDDRALGLLVELSDCQGLSVRKIISDYDICESDLHGLLAEFRAAGLIRECRVAGERGYELTDVATKGLESLSDEFDQ
ncbi:hypothetical protein ACFFQF_15840 [Haladaptatus pallidirubidus]|uniref:Transcriptional regulator n=1 Tax=Haladaptatus pallidirubidus TaxID=1008152 RepID=A0AAV3UCP5_9EURY|nr:hypothetical protein [Haladaptatus pallidirubidus]